MNTTPTNTMLRVALPRGDAMTDVLLSPGTERCGEGTLSAIRDRFTIELPRTGPETAARPIRIDSYRLQLAARNKQRLVEADTAFSPNPASCRRAIGVAAVGLSSHDQSLAPGRAVEKVLAGAGSGAPAGSGAWWEDWYRGLPPGARSVVQAEAVTWATQLFEALDWNRFEPPARIGADLRWRCPGASRVVLHGKVDVRVSVEGVPSFLVINTGTAGPTWMMALALPALVAGMARGPAGLPARVVGFWPASGQVRILPIDSGVLDRASKLVVEAARVLARV